MTEAPKEAEPDTNEFTRNVNLASLIRGETKSLQESLGQFDENALNNAVTSSKGLHEFLELSWESACQNLVLQQCRICGVFLSPINSNEMDVHFKTHHYAAWGVYNIRKSDDASNKFTTKRHPVWLYFRRGARNMAECCECGQRFSSRGTKNTISHLERRHPALHNLLQQQMTRENIPYTLSPSSPKEKEKENEPIVTKEEPQELSPADQPTPPALYAPQPQYPHQSQSYYQSQSFYQPEPSLYPPPPYHSQPPPLQPQSQPLQQQLPPLQQQQSPSVQQQPGSESCSQGQPQQPYFLMKEMNVNGQRLVVAVPCWNQQAAV